MIKELPKKTKKVKKEIELKTGKYYKVEIHPEVVKLANFKRSKYIGLAYKASIRFWDIDGQHCSISACFIKTIISEVKV